MATIKRNNDWSSEISLWKDVAEKNPTSSRAHNNLGKAYFEKGDLTLAAYHFEKSIVNIPKFIEDKFNLKKPDEFLVRKNLSANFNFDNPKNRWRSHRNNFFMQWIRYCYLSISTSDMTNGENLRTRGRVDLESEILE